MHIYVICLFVYVEINLHFHMHDDIYIGYVLETWPMSPATASRPFIG